MLAIELATETDGRWIPEIHRLPGVIVYGETRQQAIAKIEALAMRVLAKRLENGDTLPGLAEVFSVTS